MYKPGEGEKKTKNKKTPKNTKTHKQKPTHKQKKPPQLYKVDTAATDTVPGIA